MIAQGRRQEEIQAALDDLRARRSPSADLGPLINALRTPNGSIDSAALSRLLGALPTLPTNSPDSVRSYASQILGLPEQALDFRVVRSGGSFGHQGKSDAPVTLVYNTEGNLLAAIKQFPVDQVNEMAGELSGLQTLNQLNLNGVHTVTVLGAARLPNGEGVLIASPARGVTIDHLMIRVGNAAPGAAQDAAMAELREAVYRVGQALAKFHTIPPGSGQYPATTLERQLNSAESIAAEIAERIAALNEDHIVIDLNTEDMITRVSTLANQARLNPGFASFVHGDFHPGNIFFDKEFGITFIDTLRLHESINAEGVPIGAPARDFAAFLHKLATFGAEYGIPAEKITELQSLFEEAYVASAGRMSPETQQFFLARTALGVFLSALKDGESGDALQAQTEIFKQALGLK